MKEFLVEYSNSLFYFIANILNYGHNLHIHSMKSVKEFCKELTSSDEWKETNKGSSPSLLVDNVS